MIAATTRPTTEFGAILRRIRESRQMDQRQVADLAGINRSYISRLESGERDIPSRAIVMAICTALGTTDGERYELMLAAGYLPDDAREYLSLWWRLPMSWRLQLTSIAKAVVDEREGRAS